MFSLKKQFVTVLFILVLFAHLALAGELPDPKITPGAINPDVTQNNIHQTICVRGYTKKIRPPAYYTNRLKKQQLIQYGYRGANPKNFEEDHQPINRRTSNRSEKSLAATEKYHLERGKKG